MRKFIFIWFLAVGIISTIGGVWIGRSMRLAAGNYYESDFVQDTAETLTRALESGGLSALEEADRSIDPERKLHLFVFDSDLREVRGRAGAGAGAVRAFAARLRPQTNVQFEGMTGGLLAGSIVTAQDGRAYRIVVRFSKRRATDVPINIWSWTGRIAVIVAAAGLLCLWAAWRLSTPVSHLRQAARRFASGDLKARAGASISSSTLTEYRDLAHDFDDMAGRIETLVDSQRQLLRDVSHELRTPRTRLNLSINNARHAPASAIAASLDRIDQESERLNDLIERILRLSRLEACDEPPHRELIEFADFIESIVSDADFEATACKRRVSIARVETFRSAGDRELLREAVENIVRNGIRYTPEGTSVIVDAYRVSAAEYRIVVRDCGRGVPEDQLDSIFEPFYRAPQRSDSPGFGIGLAIAKRAIGLHHGAITACNAAGGGFEIAINLPVSACADA